jgi:hypothetical protein
MVVDEAYAMTGVQDTLVAIWRGDPSPDRVDALAAQMRVIAKRNNSRVFLYNVITHSTPVPSAGSRATLQKHFSGMRGTLMGAAMVLEKTGLEGALSRTVLNTLGTIARQPFPMRIFAVRRDAAVWLGNQGSAASGVALTSMAESLEARLREQHARLVSA